MEKKYKVTNLVTKESHLCDKVTVDGFDYYLSNTRIKELKPDDKYYTIVENRRRVVRYSKYILDVSSLVVIATNNPNVDIPKVVDMVGELSPMEKILEDEGYIPKGTFKPQETYPNSDDEDMIDFLKFYKSYIIMLKEKGWEEAEPSEDRILEVWKENKPIKIYFK